LPVDLILNQLTSLHVWIASHNFAVNFQVKGAAISTQLRPLMESKNIHVVSFWKKWMGLTLKKGFTA